MLAYKKVQELIKQLEGKQKSLQNNIDDAYECAIKILDPTERKEVLNYELKLKEMELEVSKRLNIQRNNLNFVRDGITMAKITDSGLENIFVDDKYIVEFAYWLNTLLVDL
jgi:hypothetical protein